MALFATAYYGLFRVGEITDSQHAVKACDVHIGVNKRKLLFILRTSKTHTEGRQTAISEDSEYEVERCTAIRVITYLSLLPIAAVLAEDRQIP